MSIFPATDIISDVARSADPRKVQLAMKRLAGVNRADNANGSDFIALARPTASVSVAKANNSPMRIDAVTARIAPRSDPASVAAKKFEAFVLQRWLEALLPKEESGSFGSGGAGNVWRSMMAEQLGAQIANAGGLGIQRLLAPAHRDPDPSRG
jgi:peptidoglycan hydrolase FlgJ